jgi:3-hydroxybutyryl-CoA dehydratase
MTIKEFVVDITKEDALKFADLSGDWNPLHTDSDYASTTTFGKQVLHGAFSAGLLSRMAGMFIPGRDCLLHNLKLRFLSPIFPPLQVSVRGELRNLSRDNGLVQVVISDKSSGLLYVDGSYEFGYHQKSDILKSSIPPSEDLSNTPLIITGVTGALGTALRSQYGNDVLCISRNGVKSSQYVDLDNIVSVLNGRKISGIVHCGWPSPDNQRLVALANSTCSAVNYYVAEPLSECLMLAQLLNEHGLPGSSLVLIGSTAAEAGRHNWGMPLYSLGKSLIPTLVKSLAVELGTNNKRCLGVVFDVISGGMNSSMRDSIRCAHVDRSPFGLIPTPEDAAAQISWVLANSSYLVSGALITLSGGSLP